MTGSACGISTGSSERHNARMEWNQRPHFLDTLPFDWTRPEARELRDFLAATFFRDEPVIELAAQAGISPAAVAWSQPMQSVWHELITKARNQDRLRELLDQVAASGDGVAARLQELTAAAPVLEAPAETPQPTWRGFARRGEFERQIFDEPTLLDVAFLQRGVELAPAVVRLLVTLPGGRYYGTAFRIGGDLLLTNHHVLFDAAGVKATAAQAWLYYELDVTGRPREHQAIECRADSVVGDQAHDWAIIRVSAPLPADVPILDLAAAGSVAAGDRVYVIQHPNGGVKKIGMHHNIVRYADEDIVQYWTDTEPGSSGSPVFSERWELVALHQRWVESGEPRAREYRNQGRRITRVAEGIKSAGLL
jgi:endonuclease G